ncbi:hypothetical protein CAPTEDRAFT_122622 [Capitella teleta]|uniref:Glucose-methanol-choline oxidoreductase N-terminal domain-containing protein n=1 Tax=Capitella teleta TaxID=283909 RepID=R7V741_CAPTE|nr:hypothetical protein CAPTEDRAFT_122622 [Capitella teleta]|eukprot:ELU14399.1 hypothetical protein CAPTEDRAFT_122622 [Capitella teleta]
MWTWGWLAAAVAVTIFRYGFKEETVPQVATVIQEEYDFVVVGSGAAGSVVAARLSEDPSVTVLVLEAGDDDLRYPDCRVPGRSTKLWTTGAVYGDLTEPQKKACLGMKNNQCRLPHGRILGGGTSVNFMVYIRGSPHEFDAWARAGCKGWSFADLLPFFKKSESMQDVRLKDSEYHGFNGPVVVQDRPISPLGDYFVEAAQELGYKALDINGADQEGFNRAHVTVNNGVRSSTAGTYLRPAMARKNLDVATLAQATKVISQTVLFANKRATGVEFIWKGEFRRVSASKEVVVSAGALDSPKLLMLSGVGPRDHLEEHGIDLVADLPVGQNLQDHLQINDFLFTIDKNISVTPQELNSLLTKANYALNGGGVLGSCGMLATGILRSRHQPADDPIPYMQLIALPLLGNDDLDRQALTEIFNYREEVVEMYHGKLDNHHGYVLGGYLNHPLSRGEVLLRSNKSSDRPIIDPHYLEEQLDVDIMIEIFRLSQRIAKTKTMQAIGAKQWPVHHPYCKHIEYDTDQFWECVVRQNTKTTFHQSGTCKMGAQDDPTAVVDPQLKVRGLDGIRVVDASIMPNVTSGNIMMATIMIGEKGASLIKESY